MRKDSDQSGACERMNAVSSFDFVANQLTNWQKVRALTGDDVVARESIAIVAGNRLAGAKVVSTLEHDDR